MAYYSYTYPDDPIVSALLMNSGNEYLDITSADTTHSNFTFMASQFGCGGLEADAELACMRTVDASAIEDFLHIYIDNGTVSKNYHDTLSYTEDSMAVAPASHYCTVTRERSRRGSTRLDWKCRVRSISCGLTL